MRAHRALWYGRLHSRAVPALQARTSPGGQAGATSWTAPSARPTAGCQTCAPPSAHSSRCVHNRTRELACQQAVQLVRLHRPCRPVRRPPRAPRTSGTSSTAWASTTRRSWRCRAHTPWAGERPCLQGPAQLVPCTPVRPAQQGRPSSCAHRHPGACWLARLLCRSCHTDRSGYKGPWTFAPTTFSNQYFVELLDTKWTKKKWDGPLQYEDPTGELMMLPTDMVRAFCAPHGSLWRVSRQRCKASHRCSLRFWHSCQTGCCTLAAPGCWHCVQPCAAQLKIGLDALGPLCLAADAACALAGAGLGQEVQALGGQVRQGL